MKSDFGSFCHIHYGDSYQLLNRVLVHSATPTALVATLSSAVSAQPSRLRDSTYKLLVSATDKKGVYLKSNTFGERIHYCDYFRFSEINLPSCSLTEVFSDIAAKLILHAFSVSDTEASFEFIFSFRNVKWQLYSNEESFVFEIPQVLLDFLSKCLDLFKGTFAEGA